MDILLINPPHPKPRDPYYFYPMGLASIIAFLEQQGYSSEFIDFYYHLDTADGWTKIKESLSRKNPDLIGITIYTETRGPALQLVSLIKKLFPQACIIAGGPHASPMAMQIIQHHPVDAVVIGEGEITFLEIVKALESRQSFEQVDGLAYKDARGQIRMNKPRTLIPDLDMLPMPAYHHFNLKTDDLISAGMQVVFSRGCPFRCVFCSESAFWGNKFRAKSVAACIDELEFLVTHYHINKFIIYDALLSVNKKRALDFCEALTARKLPVTWGARLRADLADIDILESFKKAGCIGISYGVESGSQKVLNLINKKVTIDQIVRAFDLTHQAGLTAEASIMVGNPGESITSIWGTDRLLKRIKPDRAYIIPTKIYPGTPLHESAKKKKIIDDDYWLSEKPVPHFTDSLTTKEIYFYIGLLRQNKFSDKKSDFWSFTNLIIYCRQVLSVIMLFVKFFLNRLKLTGAAGARQ